MATTALPKQRRISAVRHFPAGCGPHAPPRPLPTSDEASKEASPKHRPPTVVAKRRRVSAVRSFPVGCGPPYAAPPASEPPPHAASLISVSAARSFPPGCHQAAATLGEIEKTVVLEKPKDEMAMVVFVGEAKVEDSGAQAGGETKAMVIEGVARAAASGGGLENTTTKEKERMKKRVSAQEKTKGNEMIEEALEPPPDQMRVVVCQGEGKLDDVSEAGCVEAPAKADDQITIKGAADGGGGRMIIQGLMAAQFCPWRPSGRGWGVQAGGERKAMLIEGAAGSASGGGQENTREKMKKKVRAQEKTKGRVIIDEALEPSPDQMRIVDDVSRAGNAEAPAKADDQIMIGGAADGGGGGRMIIQGLMAAQFCPWRGRGRWGKGPQPRSNANKDSTKKRSISGGAKP